MSYISKQSILSKTLSFLSERSTEFLHIKISGRVHEKDFAKYNLLSEKCEKGKYEYVYMNYVSTNVKVSKNQVFDVLYSEDNPLGFSKSKIKIISIYDSNSGNEIPYLNDYHNICLVEFSDGVPSGWNKVSYVTTETSSNQKIKFNLTTEETMSQIIRLNALYEIFEKLEEESSDNIILAIDSIATNEYYKLPENLLQKQKNIFVCIEGVRSVEVIKGSEFDVIFTLDNIYDFIECKTKIVNFYKEDGAIIERIPKHIHSLEACHLEFEKEVPSIWKELCLDTDSKELRSKSKVLYLASNYTILRLLELLENNKN